ncbi:GNAT family N-acetyltransferase [Micromonospora sp. NEAU-HG-1]|nr:GNAT family N-acetyltransferase [Micromonospora rubida]
MLLRDVHAGDVDAYRRMRCDPVMMADLGGPRPPESVPGQLRHDIDMVARGTGLIRMIVPDPADPATVAGTVTLVRHESDGEPGGEIGWMVLPEHQGRGVAKRAVRLLLDEARDDGRWSRVHAFLPTALHQQPTPHRRPTNLDPHLQPPPQPHLTRRQTTHHPRQQRCWALQLAPGIECVLAAGLAGSELLQH